MKKRGILLFWAVMLWISSMTVSASGQIIATDVSTASDGCVFLGIEGKYIVQIQEALDRINEIRLEACQEGVLNPSTNQPLTADDYIPIKWSSDLEYIARIRAAESSLTMAHVRTNGKSCFALSSPNGVRGYGEVIAWNWGQTMTAGINQWYEEKADWVNQTAGAVTGHYTQMIDPTNLYIGLGTFYSNTARYRNTTAGEFSSKSGLDESRGTGVENCIQILEVKNSYLQYSLDGTTSGQQGDTAPLALSAAMTVTDYWGNPLTTDGLLVMDSVSWTSSNPAVASVDAGGSVSAKYCGSTEITAAIAGGGTAGITYTVNHNETKDNPVAATCTNSGLTAGRHCSVCGTTILEQKVIPAAGHTEITDQAVAATCTQPGLTAGKHCSVCNMVLTVQEVIPAKGHTAAADDPVEATCAKNGLTAGSHCSVCGQSISEQNEIPALAHKWNSGKVTKKATAAAYGQKTYSCETCGATKQETIPKIKLVKGSTYTAGNLKYKITNAKTNGKGTVTLTGTAVAKTKLKSLKVADTVKISGVSFKVTAVGDKAFKGCTKLTSLTVGKNVDVIGKEAFYGCTALSKATLGTGVTKISNKAFMNCKKLKTLTIKSKILKSVGSSAIKTIYKKAVIKVPSSKVKGYKKLFKGNTGFRNTMKIKK